jgi:hypothetical protein
LGLTASSPSSPTTIDRRSQLMVQRLGLTASSSRSSDLGDSRSQLMVQRLGLTAFRRSCDRRRVAIDGSTLGTDGPCVRRSRSRPSQLMVQRLRLTADPAVARSYGQPRSQLMVQRLGLTAMRPAGTQGVSKNRN